MADYSNAPYFAIGGMGYGRGFTPEEAMENYVKTQLRNFAAKNTVFKTRPKFEEALRTGEVKARVFKAPEGFTGFVTGMGSQWTREVDGQTEYREFEVADRVDI